MLKVESLTEGSYDGTGAGFVHGTSLPRAFVASFNHFVSPKVLHIQFVQVWATSNVTFSTVCSFDYPLVDYVSNMQMASKDRH